ncbi:hypothetical protein D3C81_1792180 [compost metagenome]
MLASGEARGQQQHHRDCRPPIEVTIAQRQSVAEGEQGQKRPWQGNHLKSLCRDFAVHPESPVGASLLAMTECQATLLLNVSADREQACSHRLCVGHNIRGDTLSGGARL